MAFSRSEVASAIGAPDAFDGTPLRCWFRIHGSSSHEAKAAILPANAGRRLSHSRTETFGLSTRSLLLIRGSGDPVNISLYPGYEKRRPFVTRAMLSNDGSPKTCPCRATVPQRNGISFARRSS